MNQNNIEIGKRIRLIRESKGMTTEQFAEIFDPPASKGTVSKWENGKYLPNNQRLVLIAKIGGISIEELKYGTTKEKELMTNNKEMWKRIKQVAEEGLDVIQSNEEVTEHRITVLKFIDEIQTNISEVIELLNNGSKEEALEKLESFYYGLDEALNSEAESVEELESRKSMLLRLLDKATRKLKELEQ